MDSIEEARSSWSTMDATQEARCKEMLAEILARLEEMNAQLRSMVEPSTPSSPPSTSILTADTDEREISTSIISTKLATTSSASLIPSPTSAPPQDADPIFQLGVTKLPATMPTKCSTPGHYQGAPISDVGGCLYPRSTTSTSASSGAATAMANRPMIDRLSRLPDSLLVGAFPDVVLCPPNLRHLSLSFHGFEGPMPSKLFDRSLDAISIDSKRFPSIRDLSMGAATTNGSVEPALAPAPALEFLIRPYDPGAGFVGGDYVGVYLDMKEAEHAHVNTFAIGLLRHSARTWPADLRTGVGTMLDAVLAPGAKDEPASTRVRLPLLLPLPAAHAAHRARLPLPRRGARRHTPRPSLLAQRWPGPRPRPPHAGAHPRQAAYHRPGAASHLPGEELAARPHARGFRDPSGDRLILANTTTSNLVTAASASPTSSPVSTSSQEATLTIQFASTEDLEAMHANCSTSGLKHTVRAPVSALTSLQLLKSTSTYMSTHEAVLTVSISTIKQQQTLPTMSLMLGFHSDTCVPVMESTQDILLASSMSTSLQCVQCSYDTQQLFEVIMSEFLVFSSATRGATWVLHHVAELRPMLWLPSSRRRWGELLKSSWPPSTQDECKSDGIDNWSVHWLSLECSKGTGLLVPQPWPPPCFILCWMICRILDQCGWNYCQLSTWASKLKAIDSLAYTQRGWVNVDLDKIEWESCWSFKHKLHWLQFLESAAQVDEVNRRGAADLFLSNLYQIWLFTEILAVGKSLLLHGEIYFITYFWSKYQISFPDLTSSQEKYRVLSVSRNMESTFVASSKDPLYSVWASLLNFASTPSVLVIQVLEMYTGGQFGQFLIIYTNGKCAWGCDQLDLEKGLQIHRHLVLLTHIMGRCGLIANAPHWRGIKTTYAKWNIGTESQVTLLLQRWRPYGNHTNDDAKTLYDLFLPTKCDGWMLLSSKLNPHTKQVRSGLCKGYPCSTTQGEAIIAAVSFDSELHRMTWDPGDSLLTKSAWGQAEFLGGENVMILLEIPWAGPIKGHGPSMAWAVLRVCANPRSCRYYTYGGVATIQAVEGPDQRTGGGELCSSRGERLLEASFG